MKIQIEFNIPGQLNFQGEWDPSQNPHLVDQILHLLRQTESTTAAEPKPTNGFAQVTPKSTGDPLAPDGVEKLGGARTKKLERQKLQETRKFFKRMSEDDAKSIMELLLEGFPMNEISDECGVSMTAVRGLAGGRSFIQVTGFQPWDDRDPEDPYNFKYYNRTNGKLNQQGRNLMSRYRNLRSRSAKHRASLAATALNDKRKGK